MFDLDRQIGRWREKLAQAEVYGQPDLDELEAHLREGTARMLSPRDFGEMALVTGYGSLGAAVAWSCILIAWVVKAWTSATASPHS